MLKKKNNNNIFMFIDKFLHILFNFELYYLFFCNKLNTVMLN